jgi:hypothetical protein
MTISEDQLETWSHQGSVTQSKLTYDRIKHVLNDPSSPFYQQDFDVFLQGSYGNDTNVWADSDVDIVVRLKSIFYYDDTELSDSERISLQSHFGPSQGYSFNRFKAEVLQWLRVCLGTTVVEGKKAIFVPGNGSRRDADVLVCVEHRTYRPTATFNFANYAEGICFWTTDMQKVVNYPKYHSKNCTQKHQATQSRFKANVRILKNMRNRMIKAGQIIDGLAPSYFLEGMLWNVPDLNFVYRYDNTFANYLSWLEMSNTNTLTCANEQHWLLRDGQSVCWSLNNFQRFKSELIRFWNSGGH